MPRIILLSDTHNKHHLLPPLPEGDILLCAGDVSIRGTRRECKRFLNWMAEQPFEHKVLIAGNHDFYFEEALPEQLRADMPAGIRYLYDEGMEAAGLRIWGSPIQPTFMHMAFNRERGAAIRKHWEAIPAGIDLLVTHGPAQGILDCTLEGLHAGCQDLRARIEQIKPRVHVCGHIHEARGHLWHQGTLFVNASNSQREGRAPKHPAMVLQMEDEGVSIDYGHAPQAGLPGD